MDADRVVLLTVARAVDQTTQVVTRMRPTYRSPHVTITFYDDVDVGVARLLAVSHRIVSNPAFQQEDA